MNGYELIILSTIALIVFGLVYSLVKYLWKWPQLNGPGFFMGVEVPAGFYDGPGKEWLKGYRALLVASNFILVAALGYNFVSSVYGQDFTPMWIADSALLCVLAMLSFAAWTRYKLGANPPVRPAAIALETRRLGDYISWPVEALMAAAVALSWWLLFRLSGIPFDWQTPLFLSWMVLGLLPGKMLIVRSSFPLAAERADEHYLYQNAQRRQRIRQMNAICWFSVFILFVYTSRFTFFLWFDQMMTETPAPLWRKLLSNHWFISSTICVPLAFWVYQMIAIFHGMARLTVMGRDLLPPGSFATPFSPARRMWPWMNRPLQIWFAIWFGGILAFFFYAHFR